MARSSSAAVLSTFSRSSRQRRPSSGVSSISPGRPKPDSFGKYVPAKKGLPAGVNTTVSGQPPPPVMAWQNAMKMWSTAGSSSRSTFTATNCSFIRRATSASSKHSRSITWHQWHAE